jgi:hypothetical protein
MVIKKTRLIEAGFKYFISFRLYHRMPTSLTVAKKEIIKVIKENVSHHCFVYVLQMYKYICKCKTVSKYFKEKLI